MDKITNRESRVVRYWNAHDAEQTGDDGEFVLAEDYGNLEADCGHWLGRAKRAEARIATLEAERDEARPREDRHR